MKKDVCLITVLVSHDTRNSLKSYKFVIYEFEWIEDNHGSRVSFNTVKSILASVPAPVLIYLMFLNFVVPFHWIPSLLCPCQMIHFQ